MKTFVIDCLGGDSIVVEAKNAWEAAKIASANGKNIAKYNNQSTMYYIWDSEEEDLLYSVYTRKQGRKIVSEINEGIN